MTDIPSDLTPDQSAAACAVYAEIAERRAWDARDLLGHAIMDLAGGRSAKWAEDAAIIAQRMAAQRRSSPPVG